jgi:exonuclease III
MNKSYRAHILGSIFFMGITSTQLYSTSIQQESSIHPVWYSYNLDFGVTKKDMLDKFRTISNQLGATENIKIPAKTADICRIATYNVHFWRNPYGTWGTKDKNDFDKMVSIIKQMDPDILILQEVGGDVQYVDSFEHEFIQMGYKYASCCSTSPDGVDRVGSLYNCILSKFPFAKEPIKKQFTINPDPFLDNQNPEQRCFVGVSVQLPTTVLSLYGTHLEVRPIVTAPSEQNADSVLRLSPENARKLQLQELLRYIKDNDTNNNIVIGAGFNGFRKQDLHYTIFNTTLLDIINKEWPAILSEMHLPAQLQDLVDREPTSMALGYLAEQGYKDSFEKASFRPPQFTTWAGTRIDFLFLNPLWNLPVKGSYVLYDWASDHIPVIMDVSI